MGRVRTKDVEGYPGGVARVWRGRVGEASEEVRVAERYVLSNVVLNRWVWVWFPCRPTEEEDGQLIIGGGDSVSGKWMSTMQMDSTWVNGGEMEVVPKKRDLSLYLPECVSLSLVLVSPRVPPTESRTHRPDNRTHHVESVGFQASPPRRAPLHPSLAHVARVGGGEYVLRHTGQVVGCDDGGVSELWMGLLGVDSGGMVVATCA
jgi:hypothetical protein